MSDPTLETEGSLASDATVDNSDSAVPSKPSGGSIIRPGVLPKQLGRYQILGVLGRGGMGAVYTAEDPELGRRVAIKVLREDLATADRDALRREAQALARLVHPNVVAVYDVGDTGHRVFLVMQLVDGAPIDQWAKDTHASRAAIVAAFRQAGRGVAAAHAAGMVHRDIKPGNILVDSDGVVRVGDFGIAQIEAEHDAATSIRIAGTPAYMAPEQAEGHATAASDQFSFCVALWEVLAGERPYDTTPSAALKPAGGKPRTRRPLKAAAHVERALTRGLSPDAAARFPSMTALVAALAPPRWRQIAAIATIAAIAIAGTAIVAARASHEAPPAAPPEVPKPGRADVNAIRHLTHYGTTACAYTPTVTSDNTVVFDRTMGDAVDLYAVPLAGGEPRQLTSAPTWEWRAHPGRSPGEVIHLVTDTSHPAASSIAALDLANKSETTLVAQIQASDAIAIAGTVYYSIKGSNALHRLVGGRSEELVALPATTRPSQLAASPSGERIALTAIADESHGRLCWVEVATAHLECFPFAMQNSRPTFASDDRTIYYDAPEGLRRHDVVSGVDELVLAKVHGYGGLAGAPDGRAIVLSTCSTKSDLEDASTSPPTVLLDDSRAGSPTVASNGTIVYLRLAHERTVAVVRAPDGHTTEIASVDLRSAHEIVISPDAAHIAFVEQPPHAGIHVQGSSEAAFVQPLTDDPHDAGPRWIDGNMIAFTRTDERKVPSIYMVSREGGPLTRLATGRILWAAARGKLLTSSDDALFWFDLATHREQRLRIPAPTASVNLVSLSPSGHWIAFATGDGGQGIWREELDTPGAKLEHVMDLAKGQTNDSLAITDEGHVIITPSTWSGDLLVVPAVAGTRF